MHQPKLTVEVLSIFPYMDNKMVPWNYHYNYVNESTMANILGIRGMTWNGRCYAPTTVEMAPLKLVEEIPKQKKSEMVPDMIKEQVTEKEALKFIKYSEYSIVE